jgi:hypothetical protein
MPQCLQNITQRSLQLSRLIRDFVTEKGIYYTDLKYFELTRYLVYLSFKHTYFF